MADKRIAAVVVTYNRLPLLETAWRAWFSIKENGLRYFVYRMIKPRLQRGNSP